jgi:plastocyanin
MLPGVRALAAAAIIAIAVAAGSCNSGMGTSYPTNPGGYGGGGGGGTPPPPAKELNSPDLSTGAVYQHRFFTAGSYPYHCIYHSPMHGTVQVVASATDTVVDVSITSATMAFPPASVKPGGRVVWTNNTNVHHTVTSD